MNKMTSALMCACITLAAGSVAAQDSMKKDDPPSMKKNPTMQECKDHMAMSKKDGMNTDGMKKDAAAMKMEKSCHDMMKKDGAMKKDMPTDPMKK